MQHLESNEYKGKTHTYHSTKVFRVTLDRNALLGVAMIGISFIIGMFFAH